MGVAGATTGTVVAGVHEVADVGQALAQLAAGVEFGKVFGAEALAQADGDGQRIAQSEHGGGGGGGGEIEAAGFALHAAIESYVAGLRRGSSADYSRS